MPNNGTGNVQTTTKSLMKSRTRLLQGKLQMRTNNKDSTITEVSKHARAMCIPRIKLRIARAAWFGNSPGRSGTK